jgi:hypothetical protein
MAMPKPIPGEPMIPDVRKDPKFWDEVAETFQSGKGSVENARVALAKLRGMKKPESWDDDDQVNFDYLVLTLTRPTIGKLPKEKDEKKS